MGLFQAKSYVMIQFVPDNSSQLICWMTPTSYKANGIPKCLAPQKAPSAFVCLLHAQVRGIQKAFLLEISAIFNYKRRNTSQLTLIRGYKKLTSL